LVNYSDIEGVKIVKEFGLEGKSAVVTGGGSGLGKEICLALARAGADVAIAARRPGPINEVAAEIKDYGRKAAAVPTDVTDSKQVNKLIERAITEFGKVDILVNNAGIAKGVDPSGNDILAPPIRPLWELSDDDWAYSINTNLTGTFYCCRAVAKHMLERKSGKVINISSMGAIRVVKGNFGYCTAKAGVIAFTRTLATTWASDNIQVNCIAPGFLPVVEMTPEMRERTERFFPMGRFGAPREIGPLAVYLASRASDYVTGQCFPIDGATGATYAPTGYIPGP
jgi:NAD(P)-dependent dehydrogenase (short-subunit alcohol dehydrogenase family)